MKAAFLAGVQSEAGIAGFRLFDIEIFQILATDFNREESIPSESEVVSKASGIKVQLKDRDPFWKYRNAKQEPKINRRIQGFQILVLQNKTT